MFSQADPTISQRFGGTGLGLYLTKKLLTQMEGTINVKSEKGKGIIFEFIPISSLSFSFSFFMILNSFVFLQAGSEFTFTLPLGLSPRDYELGKGHSTLKKSPSRQITALVVDAHHASSATLHKYLSESGIVKPTTVHNLQDGLQQLTSQHYDIAFIDSDLMVPDSDILNTFLDQLLHCASKRILLKSLVRKVPPKVVKQFTGFMLKPVKLHILEEALSSIIYTPESPTTPKNINSQISQLSSNTNVNSNVKSDKRIGITNSSANSASSVPFPTYKILLVDDNIVNCRVGQKLIQKLGHTCDIATSGQKALELFHAQKYDMIFMDIIMPEMDGYATTKLIREVEKKHCLPRTPIVALTAVDSSDKGIDEGMVIVVTNFPFLPLKKLQSLICCF